MDRPAPHITAVYPGTFDPITNGHIDIIRRASKIFGRIIVVVAEAIHKNTLFSLEDRAKFVKQATSDLNGVEVKTLSNRLLVDFCREVGATVIIRGLRAVSDFEYEFKMSWVNRRLYPGVETVFLVPSEEYAYLASSLVKEIASLGGDVKALVPAAVAKALGGYKAKIREQGTGGDFDQSL